MKGDHAASRLCRDMRLVYDTYLYSGQTIRHLTTPYVPNCLPHFSPVATQQARLRGVILLQMSHVAYSLCLCVCQSVCVSRSRFGVTLVGPNLPRNRKAEGTGPPRVSALLRGWRRGFRSWTRVPTGRIFRRIVANLLGGQWTRLLVRPDDARVSSADYKTRYSDVLEEVVLGVLRLIVIHLYVPAAD